MPIPDQILDEIQNKIDIVEVISPYVPLKKAGRNYKGLCPFHNEKTPSFMVSQDKQIYHCFGCGAGGNAFGFLMRHERMDFLEAVKLLAEKTGVKLPSFARDDRVSNSLANRLYEINDLACSFYETHLAQNKEARDYLKTRGIQEETVKTFRLGLAPKGWDGLLNFLNKKGISPKLIEGSGLAISNERGGHYDRFRDRIVFPIFDLRNKILGFGGRVLDSSLPKYVNSPETYIYSKGKNLYGFNFSKDDIKKKGFVVIVEGYLDFMLPFQSGVRNVAATLGTALTEEQARLLKRFAKTCVMVYDPDEAGELASLRSLDIFIKEGISVYIATLKKGYDPDSYIRNFGVESFNEAIKEAKNLFDYKLGCLSSRFDPRDINGKVEIAQEMLPTIAKIENAILQSDLIKRLAKALLLDEDSLRLELKKVKPNYSHRLSAWQASESAKDMALVRAEKMLLALMLEDGIFIKRAKALIKPDAFKDRVMYEIAVALFEHDPEDNRVSAGRFLNRFQDDEEAGRFILEAASMNEIISDKDKVFVDCIETVKKENLKRELERIQEAIKVAHTSKDEKTVKELVAQYNSLVRADKT